MTDRTTEVTVVVPDVAAMHALGRRLAASCRRGDVVVLTGPLGAGKTTLTQGIAAAMEVSGPVTSPSFVIARVHRGGDGPDLVHADAYRLGSLAELDDLDLDASVADSVTVVEWGEGMAERLGEEVVRVRIERDLDGEHPECRRVSIALPAGRTLADRLPR